MTVADQIRTKLETELRPTQLIVENVSHRHAGHASSPGTGNSHFEVTVVSERFRGLNRVARHKLVYGILAEEMAGPVHALALMATKTPEEP